MVSSIEIALHQHKANKEQLDNENKINEKKYLEYKEKLRIMDRSLIANYTNYLVQEIETNYNLQKLLLTEIVKYGDNPITILLPKKKVQTFLNKSIFNDTYEGEIYITEYYSPFLSNIFGTSNTINYFNGIDLVNFLRENDKRINIYNSYYNIKKFTNKRVQEIINEENESFYQPLLEFEMIPQHEKIDNKIFLSLLIGIDFTNYCCENDKQIYTKKAIKCGSFTNWILEIQSNPKSISQIKIILRKRTFLEMLLSCF